MDWHYHLVSITFSLIRSTELLTALQLCHHHHLRPCAILGPLAREQEEGGLRWQRGGEGQVRIRGSDGQRKPLLPLRLLSISDEQYLALVARRFGVFCVSVAARWLRMTWTRLEICVKDHSRSYWDLKEPMMMPVPRDYK